MVAESSNVNTGIIEPISAVNCVPSSVVMVMIPSSDMENSTGIFSILRSKITFSPLYFVIVITPVVSSIVQSAIFPFIADLSTFKASCNMIRLSNASMAESILLRFISSMSVFSLG